jgi:hypothetical protein
MGAGSRAHPNILKSSSAIRIIDVSAEKPSNVGTSGPKDNRACIPELAADETANRSTYNLAIRFVAWIIRTRLT